MKTKDIVFEDNHNIMLIYENRDVVSFEGDIKSFKEKLDNTHFRFIHIGDSISINLNKIRQIIYKKTEGEK